MKLWKVDSKAWIVRCVDGEPWPGSDAEGDKVFENTHFRREEDAWKRLESEVAALVSMSGRDVVAAEAALDRARTLAARATVAFDAVHEQLRRRQHQKEPS